MTDCVFWQPWLATENLDGEDSANASPHSLLWLANVVALRRKRIPSAHRLWTYLRGGPGMQAFVNACVFVLNLWSLENAVRRSHLAAGDRTWQEAS